MSNASRFVFATRKRTSRWQHLGAFALAGVLLMLAFPRPGWSVLAYVALVPAGIAAARTRDWRRLFWTSAVVFGVWWWWMLRWLGPISPAAPPVLGVWLGLNVALSILAIGVLHQKLRWPMVFALPLCWVSIEVLRSVWPAGGFAWYSLAQSQAKWDVDDVGRVVQTADLFGQHTVGLVVALVNGAIVDLAIKRKVPRPAIGLAAVVLVGAWGYGQWRIAQTDGLTAEGPTIAVVQTNLLQDNKARVTEQSIVADFEKLMELHAAAAVAGPKRVTTAEGLEVPAGPDAVVWPETIIPFAITDEAIIRYGETDPFASQISGLARGLVVRDGVTTIVGASGREWGADGERRYNAAHLVNAEGSLVGSPYYKQHRVPMGEYVPGPGFIEGLMEKMQVWPGYALTAGDGPVVFTLPGGWQVGTPICYEDVIASVCRKMVYGDEGKRLDALVNLTNDGWYSGKSMRRQHAQLASLRCIENRVPMARSVNTGISTFIDSTGRCRARLGQYESGVLAHTMKTDPRTTLYAALGGWPWVLLVLFTLGATVFGAIFGRPLAKHRIA
ncbi:apolipoprotein N-acyltransferase [Algisphaera agarilytica]|uniref:Apolipoprotein N-acyltransferase n=1 Tax=Algisphaera agarilytica TaxID=1385975 RepID=A0A7X0H3G0_9BACT|nr:apolipoprotein N-acyltransferase [Algisphaera agarilytica]MBB6428561.1 apolipoprotein N-acyltransferase [Algisphaera agarilytica]